MSEKIKLSNGQTFDLKPLGLIKNDVTKIRQFKFTSELPIGEVQTMFKDSANIVSIDHLLSDDTLKSNFSDCVSYKSISQDDIGVYVVELSTDAVEKQLKEMQEEITLLKAAQAATVTSTPEA